ncbi:histidinol-phosphate transaminase [Pseudoalteromonas rubra]|uniref:Histidinol-phosphate aminotransferase n=1 Tax=Pseudoalteromonas rubra TaxID=43658 RepID=A0A4Q7ELU9_9GAMM|nr:histidinol-phosphate transaminase [Pseudoalteromonas rubra]RZM85123.1 histidinol-phosphate transaminase [Pseudoalteromonas rubra]
MNWKHCVAPSLLTLSPYQAGLTKAQLKRKLGVEQVYKFASNESPLAISEQIKDALLSAQEEAHIYPDYQDLIAALAQHHGVSVEQVILGNGSIDVIELAFRLVGQPGKSLLCSEFGYSAYPLLAKASGLSVTKVSSSSSFGHQVEELLAAVDDTTAIVALDSPTNMSGDSLSVSQLEALISRLPEQVLVVLDQAYIEFVDGDLGRQTIELLHRHPNVLITRTFSKAYGLAGLRVGYGLADPQLIAWLQRLQRPFPVAGMAVAAALAALQDTEHHRRILDVVAREKLLMCQRLKQCGFEVQVGEGNFLLVDAQEQGEALYQSLLQAGFIVRALSGYQRPELLRISISGSEENLRLIQQIEQVFLTDTEVAL